MTGKIIRYFAGGNTARGFYSLFDSNIADLDRIFILKGGPGTGKSTLMKEIGTLYSEKGYNIEYLHCSSDPDSIDGVIFPTLKVGIVDGTVGAIASVPAEAISQRPDVYAAELGVASASADVGSAEAERYPKLTISGSIGRTAVPHLGLQAVAGDLDRGPGVAHRAAARRRLAPGQCRRGQGPLHRGRVDLPRQRAPGGARGRRGARQPRRHRRPRHRRRHGGEELPGLLRRHAGPLQQRPGQPVRAGGFAPHAVLGADRARVAAARAHRSLGGAVPLDGRRLEPARPVFRSAFRIVPNDHHTGRQGRDVAMKTMKRSTLVIALVALAVVIAAAVFMTRKPADKAAAAATAGKTKDGAPAQAGAHRDRRHAARPPSSRVTLAANGNIAAWQEASIGSESNGLQLARGARQRRRRGQEGPGAGHASRPRRCAPTSRRRAPRWPKPAPPPPTRPTMPRAPARCRPPAR